MAAKPFAVAVVLSLVASGWTIHARAQAQAGVLRVGANNYAQAIAECTSKGDEWSVTGNDVFEIRISTLKDASILDYLPPRWKSVPDVNETHFRTEMKIFPYQMSVYTPCSRIAFISREARRRFSEPVFPSASELEAGGVILIVGPNASMPESFTAAADVEGAAIKRGSDIVKPTKSEIVPLKIQNRLGQEKTVQTGRFTFPMSTFLPGSDLDIVLVGPTDNHVWSMTDHEVSRIR